MPGISWIEDVLGEITDVETPQSWLYWSLVTAISAAVGNNYHLRALKGNVIYRPNLYVILLGESGLGKAYGINLAKSLVNATNNTRVIAGRSSIQAIVTELSKQKTRPDGLPPIADSRGFIVNGELSSAIIADVDALSILTDLYDGVVHDEWVNSLKLSGKETLKNPYITALFGTAPAGFYDSIPQANIEGGYIGRNLIIYEEKRAKNLDLLDDDQSAIDKIKDHIVPVYAEYLKELYKQKGQLIPNPEAKELFNSWRRRWRSEQKVDRTGFLNRVPDHTLKVSMILCLSRYNNGGIISEQDIDEAIKKVTGLIYSNSLTTDGRGLDPEAGKSKIVLDILIRSPDNELSRKKMLAAGHGNFDAFTLDKIVSTLEEMNWIIKDRYVAGAATDWIYKLSGEPLAKYLQWKKSQNGEVK